MIGSGAAMLAAGPAHAAVSPGVGSSYAQSLQDTPKDGSLSVGVVLGEALAGHTNDVARAQSQGLDETAIGSSLGSYNCGTPPSQAQLALVSYPLQAETGQPGADQGMSSTPSGGTPNSFGSDEFVKATSTPYGEADTSYAGLAVPGSVFRATGMVSKAWSGLVNGQRVAAATEDIKSLDIAGVLQLSGLHWEATYPSGGSGSPTGSFSIGNLTIGGTPVPTQNPVAALDQANQVLGQIGLHLGVPKAQVQQGIEMVTPLELDVVHNDRRDAVVDRVVTNGEGALYPVTSGLENGFGPPEPAQITQALCQSDTPITVADIAIASVDGAGAYVTSFGGVNATSGEAPVNPFQLGFASFNPGSSQSFYIPGTAGSAGSAAVPSSSAGGTSGAPSLSGATAGSGSTSGPATGGGVSTGGSTGRTSGGNYQPTEPIAATGHSPGGPLLGIGLGALASLLLLAEGDRRLMRRAQRGQARFADLDD